MSDAHSHGPSVRTYFVIFLALMGLLVVTVVLGYLDFGAWSLPIAMLIALIKATLILLFFMHVKYSSRWVALFFGGSLYVAVLGTILLFADYMLRA